MPLLRPAFTWPTMLGGAGGGGLGYLLAHCGNPLLAQVMQSLAELGGQLLLVWLRGLAVPLIISSLILGAVGLEPMRAMGRVLGKTFAWMVLSGFAASLVGLLAAFIYPTAVGESWTLQRPMQPDAEIPSNVAWGWPALVLVALGLAYFRNQVEEGHARALTRLCRALDDILEPLLALTARLAPCGAFALGWAVGGRFASEPPGGHNGALLAHTAYALATGWACFAAVVLPLALWLFGRVPPGRFLTKFLPAAAVAATSRSIEGAFALTFGAARARCHLSNRTAAPVLAVCAALHREGLALGCVVVAVCCARASGVPHSGFFYLTILLSGTILACGGAILGAGDGAAAYFLVGLGTLRPDWLLLGLGLERIIVMGGAAVSVLSHASAAAIIAKSEGEYWLPGPPPSPEELEGLKAQFEAADN